ncbi:MAG TPA: MerR family transcriptional regulator [Solirubrobacteraceae bacterium]|jgi:DNA-binding transcriptional MerR regulator|nr:MerR family transcriptional regulator [Solirubrobacteraceae bacterium]
MTEAQAEQRLTIDELAHTTGLTVRNVRSYQSRGLIPPPQVQGRVGYYAAEHLARLQLIREMQAQGFNLAAIAHLLEQASGSSEQVLGFTRSLMTPFETEAPEIVGRDDLLARLGGNIEEGLIAKAEGLGLVIAITDDSFEVPSPILLSAGERLVALGVPLDAALDMMDKLRRDTQRIAQTFVQMFLEYIWKPFDDAGRPESDWPQVRAALDQLRPLASEALTAAFGPTMSKAVEVAFGREIVRGRARKQ